MAPGSTGAPYVTMRAPARLMAPGVLSSGSTLMPPVHSTMSTPAARASAMAATTSSMASPGVARHVTLTPKRASLRSTTGVKRSSMSPLLTSEPVAITAAVRMTYGATRMSGPCAATSAAASACATTAPSITSGITRVPARASPARTPKLPRRVATITWSTEFTAARRSESTRNTPSCAAFMPILPSRGSPAATQPSPRQSAAMRRAASSSCSQPGRLCHTYRCALPMLKSTGTSSAVTTWPLRKRAPL